MRRPILLSILMVMFLPAAASATPTECETLWLQRNSIFRDAGYCFRTPKGIQLFGNAGCKFDDERDLPLSDRQREAVRRIVAEEGRNRCGVRPVNVETFDPIKFRIELSAAALRKLAENGETIRVAAMYFGNTPRANANDANGDVALGDDYFDIPPEAANAVTTPVRPFARRDLEPIFDRTPRVNFNIYSSRKVFKDNLLDCSGPQDSVVDLAREVQVVRCKLIGERD